MRSHILSVALCGFLVAVSMAGENIYKFDMGTKDSPVWEGFTQVTKDSLYDPGKGFGWEKTDGIQDDARRPLLTGGGRPRPDDLCGDFVYHIDHPFFLDVPDGEYQVYLILGDSGLGDFYPCATQTIRVNGDEKYREDITADNFFTKQYYFRCADKEWRGGDDDLWQKWVEPYFKPIIFTTKAVNKRLSFQFSPTCRLTCLIVYSVGAATSVEKEIAQITQQRKQSFANKYYKGTTGNPSWEGQSSEESAAKSNFTPSAEQKNKGYVIFTRDYTESVFPVSLPLNEEIEKELSAFATPGEFEPITFCVRPFKDLKGVKVSCAGLTGDQSAKINSDRIRIRHVAYREKPYFVVSDRNSYEIQPFILKEKNAMDFESGVTRRVWITVEVPADVPAGLYQGKIRVQPENAGPSEIPIKVKVLPFPLAPMPSDASFGFYYYPPTWLKQYFPMQDKFWEMVGKELELLKKYNFTALMAGLDLPPMRLEGEELQIDFKDSFLDRFMGIYCSAGMKAPLAWYHYTDNALGTARRLAGLPGPKTRYATEDFSDARFASLFKGMTTKFQEHGHEMGWPDFYYYVADEFGARDGDTGVIWAKKVSALYHEKPGLKICGGVCNALEMALVPLFDLPLLNPVVLNREGVESVAKAGKTMGLYNVGTYRLNGFYFWKMKVKMHMQWVYCTGLVDPYNPFDSNYESDLTMAFPSMDGPVSVVEMEIWREALDDYRYCATLDGLIGKAMAGNRPELKAQAEQSRQVLDSILANIRPDYLWYSKEGRFPSPDVYNKLRWKIAQEIIKLTKAGK